MKQILLSSILALSVSATTALADVAVYSGSTVLKQTSEALSGTFPVKVVQILDLPTGNVISVTLFKKGPVKKYKVGQPVTVTKVSVEDKNGKTYTVLARALTTGEVGSQVIDSLLLKGQDTSVSINKNTDKVSLPKKLQGGGALVSVAAPSSLTEATAVTLKLDEKLSQQANEAETNPGTVETALDLVKASLEAQGYSEGDL